MKHPRQRMTDDRDSWTTNPLSRPEPLDEEEPETDEYKLNEVFRGRMFCLAHGRECYRRTGITGDNEWVCPDERHQRPIQSS